MFVKIEGSYINLALVHSIDLNDDGTATLWFTGADGACRDVTADGLKVIEAAIFPRPKTMSVKSWMIGSPETGEQWVYDAEEVDKVIAAKDKEIADLKKQLDQVRAIVK